MVATVKIIGDKIILDDLKDANKLNRRGFGRIKDDFLELNPSESLYLFKERKIKILRDDEYLDYEMSFSVFSKIDERFEQKFIVYRDLRKRGYKIDCFHELIKESIDYRIRPKRDDQGEAFIVSVNEREKFSLKTIISYMKHIDPIIEELWIGVVDEEGDITYYRINEIIPRGNIKDIENIRSKGILLKNLVIIKNRDVGEELFRSGFYGNLTDDELTLSLIEALHLVDADALEVYSSGTKIGFEDLMEISKTYQPDIERRYQVYKDLKKKRLCIKTGYKFGTHFRAYERNPDKHHAEYLIDVVEEDFESTWPTISRGIRLAHSVRKMYVLAVVSKETRYIGMERIKP